MAKKILAVLKPSANTNTTAYTVPSAKETVVSTISICNVSAVSDTARIFVWQSGGSASTSNAIYYDLAVGVADSFQATCGITLAVGDTVTVYSLGGNLTFHIFGDEGAIT